MNGHRMIVALVAGVFLLVGARAVHAGACCFDDGSCVDVPDFVCVVAGGSYQGDGTSCGTSFCTGACCLQEGICLDATADNCETAGGLFLGIGTVCIDSFCGLGACCLLDESCTALTVSDCNQMGGSHLGPGTTCATTICHVRTGAGPLSPMPQVVSSVPAFDDLGGTRVLTEVVAHLKSTITLSATVENRSVFPNTSTWVTVQGDALVLDLPGFALITTGLERGFAPPLDPDDGSDGTGADYHDFGPIAFTARDEKRRTAPLHDLTEYIGPGSIPISFDGVGTFDFETPTIVAIEFSEFLASATLTLAYRFDQFGACCFPDDTCQLETADDCASLGGLYQGDGVFCTRGGCPMLCPADIGSDLGPGIPDGNVDAIDLLIMISQWNCTKDCLADISGPTMGEPDGAVDTLDLLLLISQWGSPSFCK